MSLVEHGPAHADDDKRSASRESVGGRQLITIADAARMLGNCTVRAVERWHNQNPKFPRIIYITNRRYFDVAELQRFIADSQGQSNSKPRRRDAKGHLLPDLPETA
jgi:hypothetical protein